MGNYCCSDEKEVNKLSSLTLKKKVSLEDPQTKKKYEKSIGDALNDALSKFKGQQRVQNIRIKSRLGKGGQGEVFLVEVHGLNKKGDFEIKDYAMKRVSKRKLDVERTKQALMLENEILSSYESKFLIQIQYAFQNKSELFYMMEIAKGGDLFSYISDSDCSNSLKRKMFEEKGETMAKFVLAGVILGINYLHKKDIIYRDLKPENILIFEDGYPRLADFGVARKFSKNQKYYDIKGTAIYFSPEMISKKGYDKGSDIWAIGILLYELLFKCPPFHSDIIKSSRFENEVEIFLKSAAPKNISKDGFDLIKKLLAPNPVQRIGYNNMDDIKNHNFFKEINWVLYESKELKSPFFDILEQICYNQIRKTTVINETIETQHREDIPFTFVRKSRTRESTIDQTPKRGSKGKQERDMKESDHSQNELDKICMEGYEEDEDEEDEDEISVSDSIEKWKL